MLFNEEILQLLPFLKEEIMERLQALKVDQDSLLFYLKEVSFVEDSLYDLSIEEIKAWFDSHMYYSYYTKKTYLSYVDFLNDYASRYLDMMDDAIFPITEQEKAFMDSFDNTAIFFAHIGL